MSEILGHDIDGKPLRPGDAVVFVGPKVLPEYLGQAGRVLRRLSLNEKPVNPGNYHHQDHVLLDDGLCIAMPEVRRLDDRTGHQSADAEFTTWLRGIGAGKPEVANA